MLSLLLIANLIRKTWFPFNQESFCYCCCCYCFCFVYVFSLELRYKKPQFTENKFVQLIDASFRPFFRLLTWTDGRTNRHTFLERCILHFCDVPRLPWWNTQTVTVTVKYFRFFSSRRMDKPKSEFTFSSFFPSSLFIFFFLLPSSFLPSFLYR